MPVTAEQVDLQLRRAYGPFVPGSDARRIRAENAERGLKTCWNSVCLTGYQPRIVNDEDGTPHHLGTGDKYCSWACYVADSTWPWVHGKLLPTDRPPTPTTPPPPLEILADMGAALAELRAYIAGHEGAAG